MHVTHETLASRPCTGRSRTQEGGTCRDENQVLKSRGVLLFSSYFEDLLKASRAAGFPLEALRSTKGIPQDALNHVTFLHENLRSTSVKATLQHAVSCAAILSATSSDEVITGILVVVGTAFESQTLGLQSCFLELGEVSPELPYSSFFRILNRADPFIQLCSAKIIACLICYSTRSVETEHLGPYFSCLQAGLTSPHSKFLDITVQLIQGILATQSARRAMFDFENGVIQISLLSLLKPNACSQIQYQVACCFWLFTFDEYVARSIQRRHGIIPTIIELCKNSTKEKITRVTLATLVQLTRKSGAEDVNLMLGCKLLPHLRSLKLRKFDDEDILADLTELEASLAKAEQSLTTWDVYRNELLSGKLEWSPVHTSELFWQQNAKKVVSEENSAMIAILAHQILESDDYIALAVACHDIGECSKYYPEGRREMEKLGAKLQLMTLMSHSSPEVRLQALLAVQKFLTNSWDI